MVLRWDLEEDRCRAAQVDPHLVAVEDLDAFRTVDADNVGVELAVTLDREAPRASFCYPGGIEAG